MLTTKYGKEAVLAVILFIVVVFIAGQIFVGDDALVDNRIYRPSSAKTTEADVENTAETETQISVPAHLKPDRRHGEKLLSGN